MENLNDWHDYVRVLLIGILIYSLLVLTIRFRAQHKTWNDKTKDYWYAMTMWCLTAGVLLVQGIALNLGFTPGFVLLVSATLVTGRGLHRKGDWGGNA